MAVLAGLDSPTIDEFIAHPDYQQIAAFFLGAVFITSLNYSSVWLGSCLARFWTWIFRKRSATNDVENVASEKVSIAESSTFIRAGENHTLVFTLSICFVFASIAYFASLLSFNPDTGGAACAFVVAWGGMASQTAHIIGLVILSLELRELGIPRLEFFCVIGALLIGMVLVFVNNAIGTGAIRLFEPLNIAICYRKHFLPTALASSLVYFLLEVYVLVRLALLILPRGTLLGRQMTLLRDIRIWRAISLLLLEVLTIGPSAKHITVLADFIPLSIGALAVLFAFNYRTAASSEETFQRSVARSETISRQSVAPPSSRGGWFSRRSFGSSGHNQDANPTPAASPGARVPHPFSAQSLNDPTLQEYGWLRRNQLRKSNAGSTMSTQEGVIQVVESRKTPTQARGVIVSASEVQNMRSNGRRHNESKSVSNPAPPMPEVSARTSILMHPWHRPPSVAVPPNRVSMRASDRTSYLYQGYTMPTEPITAALPSSAHPVQRYSSSTLTSPMLSQEGGEAPRKPVRLLAFESNFRTNRDSLLERH